MLVLAFDTTLPVLSVCVCEDERLLARMDVATRRSTSSRLFAVMDAVLKEAGVSPRDLGLISVCVGPGSFTGVRVGVAAAKAMGYALGLEVAAVSTLEAMALSCPVRGRLLFPLVDARRGQFYGALFRWRGGCLERLTGDSLFSKEEVEGIAPSVLFIGEAAERLGFSFFPVFGLSPFVAGAGLRMAREGRLVSVSRLKPVYLRPSDAEEKSGIIVYNP